MMNTRLTQIVAAVAVPLEGLDEFMAQMPWERVFVCPGVKGAEEPKILSQFELWVA